HECQADLRQVERACERGTAMIKQLLAFSSKQVLRVGVVDVCALICDFERILRRVIGADIELHIHTPAESCRALVDAGQLEQVLMNMVVNARDAMPGGGTLTIEVTRVAGAQAAAAGDLELADGDQVRIAVTDTGVGM